VLFGLVTSAGLLQGCTVLRAMLQLPCTTT